MPGWLDKVVDYALDAATPDRGEAPPVNLAAVPRQSAGDYLREQAAAFDPRSFEGIANLAATFFPGPHPLNPRWGSRFVGKLNPSQRLYLHQLHNIEGVPGQKGDPPRAAVPDPASKQRAGPRAEGVPPPPRVVGAALGPRSAARRRLPEAVHR